MRARFALFWLLASILVPLSARAAVTVFLVRHAERAPGDMSSDPPLTPAGRDRAALLARMLADAGVRRIFVTEFRRTQETAAPLASTLNLTPQPIPGADPKPLVRAIRSLKSGAALVVGHSNTIPALIAALGARAPKIDDADYDNLFILTIAPHEVTLTRLHYGAPRPASLVARNATHNPWPPAPFSVHGKIVVACPRRPFT